MEGKAEAVAMKPDDDELLSKQIMKQEAVATAAAAEKEDIQVQCNDTTTEQEKNKIELMRALVEKRDPSSREVDDYALRRFLRAQDLDLEKSASMFLKYLKWRQSFVPKGSISVCEIPSELAHNNMFMQGVDKQGCPIAVVFGGRHIQNKLGGLEEFKRMTSFFLLIPHGLLLYGQWKWLWNQSISHSQVIL